MYLFAPGGKQKHGKFKSGQATESCSSRTATIGRQRARRATRAPSPRPPAKKEKVPIGLVRHIRPRRRPHYQQHSEHCHAKRPCTIHAQVCLGRPRPRFVCQVRGWPLKMAGWFDLLLLAGVLARWAWVVGDEGAFGRLSSFTSRMIRYEWRWSPM